MKKFIVYFPYKLRQQTSGSAVRPVKILEAFQIFAEKHGFEMISIHGETNERKKAFEDLYKNENPEDFLFCYMENATIPIWLSDDDHLPRKPFIDLKFLKYLHKNNIPLGVFYRDIYWKFNSLYKVKPIIKQAMRFLFRIELAMYKKYSKIFYLPSIYMNKYVGEKDEKVTDLPPGGVDLLLLGKKIKPETNISQAIYVGGINPRYGIYDTLKAFEELNQTKTKIKLILICRKEEFSTYQELMKPYLNKEWIEIHHAFGEQLLPFYERADFGIVPIKRDTYNDFAVAVKLFEYISYGLPVLATNCLAQTDIVEKSKLGIIVPDNSEDILNGLKEMSDLKCQEQYRENVKEALLNEHLWIHRVEKVYNTLT
jgi:glycosyltransferase involved in cell wall biosynthesis